MMTRQQAVAAAIHLSSRQRPAAAPSVPTDGPSGYLFPSTAGHFSSLGIAAPSSAWMCQETSGNLADSFGGLTLTAGGAGGLYAQAVAGYTRTAVGAADAATAIWSSTATVDAATTSQLLFVYAIILSTPAALRSFAAFGLATSGSARVETTPRFRAQFGGALATGTVNPTGTVRLFAIQRDVSGSANRGASGPLAAELLTPASTALSGVRVGLGAVGGANCPAVRILAGYYYTGAEAEGLASMRSKYEALQNAAVAW